MAHGKRVKKGESIFKRLVVVACVCTAKFTYIGQGWFFIDKKASVSTANLCDGDATTLKIRLLGQPCALSCVYVLSRSFEADSGH